ncbi:1-deoxy-D-xylulose-5-phosphate reductoisomerase [Sanguibacter sp. A247]|uniref:1-deoxy-D-xylulose-5-phosphate reductoisomerase n=1 Tax=Sanguibacter sp. A247 TaxID=3457327 RepID=UPI003FD8575A
MLGSTGSIGTQALDVIARHPGAFRVRALAAGGSDIELLARQVRETRPEVVAVAVASGRDALASALGNDARGVEILAGPDAATTVAGLGADVVLNGITGSVGLEPTLTALKADSVLALANKESLVVGGALVTDAIRRADQLVPVDSEHSAIAQSLRGGRRDEVRRLILTASGGPFRGWTREQMASVTAEQALAHPTWSMGPVVTVNSASMMNKGLELIEAHLLFAVPVPDITVVVHPQSIVHSMVEFHDGSTIAQASPPDMRIPIALGLTWPERVADVAPACDWTQASEWTFEPLDEATFSAVRLAREVLGASATHPAVLNAVNEECVDAFLAGRIGFLDIVATVERVLDEHDGPGDSHLTPSLVLETEAWARARAHELLARA